MKQRAYLFMTLSSFFWGVSFILTKSIFDSEPHMGVFTILTFRLMLASMVMVPLLLATKKLERIARRDIKWFLLIALAEPFTYYIFETYGLRHVSASLASIVVALIPLFIPFGMRLVYSEKIPSSTMTGIVLSCVGIGIMLSGNTDWSGELPGITLLNGAIVTAIAYTVLLVRVVNRYRPTTVTAYQNLLGFLYYLPVMLITEGDNLPRINYTSQLIGTLLALGIFCSTVAYTFYNYGIHHLGASSASIFNNIIPIFSLIAAVAIGQEEFAWEKAVGIVVAIGGVVIAQLKAGKQQEAGHTHNQ